MNSRMPSIKARDPVLKARMMVKSMIMDKMMLKVCIKIRIKMIFEVVMDIICNYSVNAIKFEDMIDAIIDIIICYLHNCFWYKLPVINHSVCNHILHSLFLRYLLEL